jgi:hypothetical protein
MVAFATFLVAWLINGTEARGQAASLKAAADECSDLYPEECFPSWSCYDGHCSMGTVGFESACTPAVEVCEETFPNWCSDMWDVCTAICAAHGNLGIQDFSCSDTDDCEVECICGVCIEG